MLFCHQVFMVSVEKSSIFRPIPLCIMGHVHLACTSSYLYSFTSFMTCLNVLSFVLVNHWASWVCQFRYLTKFGKLSGFIQKNFFSQKLHHLTWMWNLKKLNTYKKRVECWLPGVGRWGKWGDIGQSVQSWSYVGCMCRDVPYDTCN